MSIPARTLYLTDTQHPDLAKATRDFEKFKAAALLIGDAARDADHWNDITVHLENAFQHPLYQEDRTRFADSLATAIASGIFAALE